MPERLKKDHASRWSIVISVAFHGLIIGALFFFAAREGMLGKQLKKIAVTMVPKEKPVEKPKEKPPEPKPVIEPPKADVPVPSQTPPPSLSRVETAPAPVAATGPAAPPSATLPSFDFQGGKTVETSSDPNVLYKGFIEFTLRSQWIRPDDVADQGFVAEVELDIDRAGRLTGSTWKKGSGDPVWDAAVRRVVARTPSIGRPPPKGFPEKVLVRFDVQLGTEMAIE